MFKSQIIAKIEELISRKVELEEKLGDNKIFSNPKLYNECAKEYAQVKELQTKYLDYKKTREELAGNERMLSEEHEEEFYELLRVDIEELKQKQEQLERAIKLFLIPEEKVDQRNTIVEIRAGTGGEEAALFAAEIFRMYSKYAEIQGWKIETMNTNATGLGGIKEIIFMVSGGYVFKKFKYESGTHRVQRVPTTEASGRIHTSAITVAVLPEAEDVEINIDPNDLRIDTFRASGHGGQSVNTMDSAVRIAHLPTGMVVQCQDEKSQLKNKQKALKVLKARLLEKATQEQATQRASDRRNQIGSGDRSEKIRTYNYPQNRVTDHRTGLTLYSLDKILDGEMEDIIVSLLEKDSEQKIDSLLQNKGS